MAVDLERYRFTVDDYHRMAEAGILGEDDRVELIEGEILQMSPIGGKHIGCVIRLTQVFRRIPETTAIISVQNPIRVGDNGEPQPDLVLLRPKGDYYASGAPTPPDILLVVEVADSSVEYDRQIKAPLYARSGIPEYWLVDVGREHVIVFREPIEDTYRTTQVFRRGEKLSPLAFPGLTLGLDEILG